MLTTEEMDKRNPRGLSYGDTLTMRLLAIAVVSSCGRNPFMSDRMLGKGSDNEEGYHRVIAERTRHDTDIGGPALEEGHPELIRQAYAVHAIIFKWMVWRLDLIPNPAYSAGSRGRIG